MNYYRLWSKIDCQYDIDCRAQYVNHIYYIFKACAGGVEAMSMWKSFTSYSGIQYTRSIQAAVIYETINRLQLQSVIQLSW